jgi:hypothetical protein
MSSVPRRVEHGTQEFLSEFLRTVSPSAGARRYFDANYDEVDVVALYELTKVAVARPRAEDPGSFSGAVLVACRDRREREIG